MVTLEAAVAAARAELALLQAKQRENLTASGLQRQVELLTEDNRALTAERQRVQEQIAERERQWADLQEQRAALELELKGARSRITKLQQLVQTRR